MNSTNPTPAGADSDGLFDMDRTVQRILAGRAVSTSPASPMDALICYTALCEQADPDRRYFRGHRHSGIGSALERIAAADLAAGRPHLAALVNLKGERRPGDGFWTGLRELGVQIPEGSEMAYWRSEVQAVVGWWAGRVVAATLAPPAAPAPAAPAPAKPAEATSAVADAVIAAVARYGHRAVLAHMARIAAFHGGESLVMVLYDLVDSCGLDTVAAAVETIREMEGRATVAS